MKKDRNILVYIIWIILGILLLGLGVAEIVDEFWSNMGATLAFVGILRLIRLYRFCKNEEYRERVEIEIMDERNRFIRNKAWAWSGYLFIMMMSVCIIILKAMGQELLSVAAGLAVCFMLILYWGSYLVLRKKY